MVLLLKEMGDIGLISGTQMEQGCAGCSSLISP